MDSWHCIFVSIWRTYIVYNQQLRNTDDSCEHNHHRPARNVFLYVVPAENNEGALHTTLHTPPPPHTYGINPDWVRVLQVGWLVHKTRTRAHEKKKKYMLFFCNVNKLLPDSLIVKEYCRQVRWSNDDYTGVPKYYFTMGVKHSLKCSL